MILTLLSAGGRLVLIRRKPDLLAEAVAAGFRVEDLGEVAHNRAIAEHLQKGTSLRWCMLALGMSGRGRSA